MIPHSTLSDEIFGNELRDRVTTCRKRVRRNRATNKKTGVRHQSAEITAESDSDVSQLRQYTKEYTELVVANVVEKQEVGIT